MKFFRAISALATLLCPAGWHKNGSNQHGFSAQYYDAFENKHEGQGKHAQKVKLGPRQVPNS